MNGLTYLTIIYACITAVALFILAKQHLDDWKDNKDHKQSQ